MNKLKVLMISGSLRKDSYNRKALQIAKKFTTEFGVEVEEVDLKALNLPIYDQDIQDQGLPESVKKFKQIIEGSDVIFIASPEYNYSVPGGLKNALDWASREGNSFTGKVGAIFGASSGPYGTLRSQPHLRQIMTSLNVLLLPQPQVMIGNAPEIFDTEGNLTNQKNLDQLKNLIQKTLELAQKLKS